jgi:hypothetical protein
MVESQTPRWVWRRVAPQGGVGWWSENDISALLALLLGFNRQARLTAQASIYQIEKGHAQWYVNVPIISERNLSLHIYHVCH